MEEDGALAHVCVAFASSSAEPTVVNVGLYPGFRSSRCSSAPATNCELFMERKLAGVDAIGAYVINKLHWIGRAQAHDGPSRGRDDVHCHGIRSFFAHAFAQCGCIGELSESLNRCTLNSRSKDNLGNKHCNDKCIEHLYTYRCKVFGYKLKLVAKAIW